MRVLSSIFIILLVALAPAASDNEHGDHSAEVGDHSIGHHAFRHEVAFSLGGTKEQGHDTEFTWSVEYTYSFTPKFGVGGIFEYAGGGLRNTIVIAPFYWKPVGGLIFLAGPGVEFHKGRDNDEHHLFKSGGETDEDATYFVFRVGTAYSFHVGERYAVIPSINLDLVEGEKVWVGGVTFGVMF